jgi:hypothetical protein
VSSRRDAPPLRVCLPPRPGRSSDESPPGASTKLTAVSVKHSRRESITLVGHPRRKSRMRTASGWRAAGSRPSAAAPNALSANDGGARGGGLPGAEGILVAIDARAHLPRFVGRPVHTIRQDQPNRVIAVDRPDVVVATHRSPAEQRIAIAEARPAMDILERTRDPLADRNIVGYRSAFIEAVLATSPRVPVPTRPWPYQALTAFERLKLGMSNLPPHLIGPEPPRPVHRRRGGIRLRPCWRLLRLPG